MNARFGFVLLVAVACGALCHTGTAHAQIGLHRDGIVFGAYDVGRLYGVLAQNVPYYAAFPPVYYSAPIPRAYGHVPFAYPPGVRTPEILAAPKAMEILNPHVVPASASDIQQETDKITYVKKPQPLLVLNPYASQHLALASETIPQSAP
ncbi:MAG: hypothetical protein MK171_10180 [Pirellulales bacterium]|nr:hypothetical protein [Pirellulales bacterium]